MYRAAIKQRIVFICGWKVHDMYSPLFNVFFKCFLRMVRYWPISLWLHCTCERPSTKSSSSCQLEIVPTIFLVLCSYVTDGIIWYLLTVILVLFMFWNVQDYMYNDECECVIKSILTYLLSCNWEKAWLILSLVGAKLYRLLNLHIFSSVLHDYCFSTFYS